MVRLSVRIYMNPAPDYETIGPSADAQPWIYLKITDGTDTTYFSMKFTICDDTVDRNRIKIYKFNYLCSGSGEVSSHGNMLITLS